MTFWETGRHPISAQYGGDATYAAATSSSSTLNVTAIPVKGDITARTSWTFRFTPTYTSVLGLTVSGLYEGSDVVLGCQGRGCPFRSEDFPVLRPKICSPSVPALSCPPNNFFLTKYFAGRRLAVGAQVTILHLAPQLHREVLQLRRPGAPEPGGHDRLSGARQHAARRRAAGPGLTRTSPAERGALGEGGGVVGPLDDISAASDDLPGLRLPHEAGPDSSQAGCARPDHRRGARDSGGAREEPLGVGDHHLVDLLLGDAAPEQLGQHRV